MDDRELRRLLSMAAEAEQLDHPAAGAAGRILAGTDRGEHLSLARRERSWWRARGVWIGGALAAAASLAIGVFVILMPGQGLSPGPIAKGDQDGMPAIDDLALRGPDEAKAEASADPGSADTQRSTLVAHRPAEEAVLFAVYRGANGSCECVQMNDPDWGAETRLAEVSRHELLRAGLQEPCTTLAPEVLVIGVAGKPGTLASSRQHAETIARRLGDQPLRGRDVSSMAYAAMPDLPAGTVIVAEKVSIGP